MGLRTFNFASTCLHRGKRLDRKWRVQTGSVHKTSLPSQTSSTLFLSHHPSFHILTTQITFFLSPLVDEKGHDE